MKKRWLLNSILVVVFLLIFGIACFPYDLYSNDFKEALTEFARKQKIFLQIDALHLSFPGVIEAQGIRGAIPVQDAFPAPFFFETVKLRLRSFSILFLTLNLESTLEGYGGSIRSEVSRGVFSQAIKVRNMGTFSLDKYPAAPIYGLRGNISFTGESTIAPDQAFPVANLSLKLDISDGAIRPGDPLPAIDKIQGTIRITGNNQDFTVEELRIQSSLGTVNGKGSFSVAPEGMIDTVNLTGTIALSDEGLARAGGYLNLAAGKPVQSIIRDWNVMLTKTKRGRLTFVSVAVGK